MLLGKNISGSANFSYEYFINKGFIGCKCSQCSEKIILDIDISNSGKPVEQIAKDLNERVLNRLIEKKIINLKKGFEHRCLRLNKYVLWYIDAFYSIIICKTCNSKFIAIFGIGEVQPGRDQVQFKGIWELKII